MIVVIIMFIMNKRSLSFVGTHKEIGIQVGEQYKKWGKKEVWIPPFAQQYISQQLATYKKYFPLYLEYLEGIAIGLNISKDKVVASYLTGFLSFTTPKQDNKCSTFALNNKNGVMIGKNYDWRQSSELVASLLHYDFTDKSANSFNGITDMATWEVGVNVPSSNFVIMTEDAWNDKGLYVSLNGAPGEVSAVGMCTTHAIQCVIEKCGSTDEAIELMSKIPLNNSKIFTIADKSGNLSVVEKSLEKGIFIRRSRNMIFTTNHYNHQDLAELNEWLFKNIPFHSTFVRYSYLNYYLSKLAKNLDLKDIIELMSKPPVRQNWRGKSNGDVLTIWTYGLNLSNGKYLIEFAPILKEKDIIQN